MVVIVVVLVIIAGAILYAVNSLLGDKFSVDYEVDYSGKVIVVGAGASGLTAAYILERQGVEVQVIEAQDVYGGRMREATDFADFPIDLGAEWIHEDPSVLTQIVQDDTVTVDVETIVYNPRDVYEPKISALVQADAGAYSAF